MGPLFIMTESFGPHCGERWTSYVAWSKLTQLTEVVTLDGCLCPSVVDEIRDDDWPHIVNEDCMLDYFTDLDHLLGRCGGPAGKNLLCVYREPQEHPTPPGGPHEFRFAGYDLVDVGGGISALTNCGGFAAAFDGRELNAHGLLDTLERARQVQQALETHYPLEDHAKCHVWCLFRATQLGAGGDAPQRASG
ncbi:MAG: hypothetical protein R3F56_24030 [Planctomycetota bacterium]